MHSSRLPLLQAAEWEELLRQWNRMNKYFTISQMPIVSSNYWNGVHGNTAEEVKNDFEGLQTMRILARNMAWLIKSIEAGKKANITYPEQEKKIRTNFIR